MAQWSSQNSVLSRSSSVRSHGDEEEYGGCFSLSQTDNVTPPRKRCKLQQAEQPLKKAKTIHDRMYGAVTVPALLVAVMDTEEFQRLDRIAQLGGSSFVYPSAKHTRKEHSIGVSHLAHSMVRHLQKQQETLEIDEADVLCVQLSGLVHDIGHGPYSHMFESFVRRAGKSDWTHENMSTRMIRLAVTRNSIPLARYFDCDQATADQHLNFVCRLIEGLPDCAEWPDDIGRPETKRFLFDIVSNSRSGMDVDKLDYLHRDGQAALGQTASFDWNRLLSASRVVSPPGSGRAQIAFEEKVALDINEIFALRCRLHRQVYQHRVSNVAEAMITDVLLTANASEFRVVGAGGVELRLADAADDDDAFRLLTDGILDAIALSRDEGLEHAQRLLARVHTHEYYHMIGTPMTIPTLPLCAHCHAETDFDAPYCKACAGSCEGRPKIRVGTCGASGLEIYEPKLSKLTNEQAKSAILEQAKGYVDPDKVFVHITGIKLGWKTTVLNGCASERFLWRTYDPIANVLFFNPKDATEQGRPVPSSKISPLFRAKANHERTLYCCFKGEPDNKLDQIQLDVLASAYARYQRKNIDHFGHLFGIANPSPSPARRPPSESSSRRSSVEPSRLVLNHDDDDDDDDDHHHRSAPASDARRSHDRPGAADDAGDDAPSPRQLTQL